MCCFLHWFCDNVKAIFPRNPHCTEMIQHLKSLHTDVLSWIPARRSSIFYCNGEWVIERLGFSIYIRYLMDSDPNATLVSFETSIFWNDNVMLREYNWAVDGYNQWLTVKLSYFGNQLHSVMHKIGLHFVGDFLWFYCILAPNQYSIVQEIQRKILMIESLVKWSPVCQLCCKVTFKSVLTW